MRKLTEANQELLDGLYPKGYELKRMNPSGKVIDESNVYHVLFIKIFETKGRHNELSCMVQKMNKVDYNIFLKQIDAGYKLSAITGYDEFEVIHDPTVKEPKIVKAKPGPKPKEVESQN